LLLLWFSFSHDGKRAGWLMLNSSFHDVLPSSFLPFTVVEDLADVQFFSTLNKLGVAI
jgi:hypothetical protein